MTVLRARRQRRRRPARDIGIEGPGWFEFSSCCSHLILSATGILTFTGAGGKGVFRGLWKPGAIGHDRQRTAPRRAQRGNARRKISVRFVRHALRCARCRTFTHNCWMPPFATWKTSSRGACVSCPQRAKRWRSWRNRDPHDRHPQRRVQLPRPPWRLRCVLRHPRWPFPQPRPNPPLPRPPRWKWVYRSVCLVMRRQGQPNRR